MNVLIKISNGSLLTVPISPRLTNHELYNSIYSKLPQGITGKLIFAGKGIPDDNMPIYYKNFIDAGSYIPFILDNQLPVTTTINDVDKNYTRLGERIQSVGQIYLRWRKGEISNNDMKYALNRLKDGVDFFDQAINSFKQ
jgi:hypothetical protein